uniref:Uncharacterized protein n=1 Tax=Anopheles dirus TaxID=7168 RepID=A0A182NCQ3_9DIPT
MRTSPGVALLPAARRQFLASMGQNFITVQMTQNGLAASLLPLEIVSSMAQGVGMRRNDAKRTERNRYARVCSYVFTITNQRVCMEFSFHFVQE